MPSTQAGFKRGRAGESAGELLVRFGPTVLVDVGLKSRAAAGSAPELAAKGIKALIDTGAGGDCIDDDLAQSLGLPSFDEGVVSGIGGRHHALIYSARVFIPSLGQLLFQPFTGVKLAEGEQWHRLILGRSFLKRYRLTYDGLTGEVDITDI